MLSDNDIAKELMKECYKLIGIDEALIDFKKKKEFEEIASEWIKVAIADARKSYENITDLNIYKKFLTNCKFEIEREWNKIK